METEVVTLTTLAGGAVVELFQAELGKVLASIADVNTDPTKAREIIVRVKIHPDEKREMGQIQLEVSSKIPSFRPVSTVLFFSKHRGEYVAVEHNPKQTMLPLEPPAAFGKDK